MTPEQLNEIEKLAEAATPGPWPTTGWVEDPHGIPYGVGKDILDGGEKERIAQAERDTAFIGAMRKYALPLVKALREARAIIDHYERKDGPTFQAHLAEAKALMGRDAARAEVERLKERLSSEQHFIDAVCHYRNLAIVLGAKPEQMLGKFDRELCEGGIDPDETSGGYHISVNQQLDELKDVWNELEKLRLERDAVTAKLGQLREALTKRYGSKTCVASIGFGQTCVGNQSVYCHVCHIQHLLGLPSRAPPADELELAIVARNAALAKNERLRSVLRLLWEEAQDKAAIRDDTTDAVEAALKDGDR